MDELIEQDRSGLLQWLRRGGKALDEPTIRSFERLQIEQTLASDSHAAETAKYALDQAELELEILNRQVAAVERRHMAFVNAALVGAAKGKLAEYVAKAQELRRLLIDLGSLAQVVGIGKEIDVRGLPLFWDTALPRMASGGSRPQATVYRGWTP